MPIAAAFSHQRRPLIYSRFSSELQSDRSNEDQEREVRLLFQHNDIDDRNAIVLHDRAESGTTNSRPKFLRMMQLVEQGQLSVVGVDDQARASRNDDVIGVVKDFVFHGTRFLSGDGVDTSQPGWQTRVRLHGIHNAMCTEETARRVRRGMKGRALDGKSAGDICYGHYSFFDDPDYAATYNGRGPKPTKSIGIYEPHAIWVREIFRMIADGWSFNQIARHLQDINAPVGRNIKRWTAKAVSRVAHKIKKYTGEEWTWGATTIIRDAKGRKKQIPAPEDQVVRVSRPELRIVDAETAARAQVKLEQIYAKYGFKAGQKKRGPKAHYTELYPRDILFKVLVCGPCGSVMYQNGSGKRQYRQCKHYGNAPGDCQGKTRVPAEETRRVLTDFVAELLQAVPDWLDMAIANTKEVASKQQTQLPAKIDALRKCQSDRVDRRRRLLELVETGDLQVSLRQSAEGDQAPPSSVQQRLAQLDQEIEDLADAVAKAEAQLGDAVKLPDHNFIAEQIRLLPSTLLSDERKAASLLGELFGTVRVFRVAPPQNGRSYHKLTFRLEAWRIIKTALAGKLPESVAACFADGADTDSDESPEITLYVGRPPHGDDLPST